MPNAYTTTSTLRVSNEIMEWAKTYLMTENPHIRRPHGDQTTCPFVKASIENDTFHLSIHPEVNGKDEETIERLMVGTYIEEFSKLPPFRTTPTKKALLVVFPNIPEKDAKILDLVHRNIKPNFVAAGLMIGQFHPTCDDAGVYNRANKKVSVAPVPLIAIRYMSAHDILFLHGNEEWFDLYNRWFGERFKDAGNLGELEVYAEHYYNARDRYRK